MKIRVFRKPDNSVIYDIPSARYQKEGMWEKCPIPEALRSLERIDLEDSEIPRPQSDEEYYHEMVYFEGPTRKENLKIDKHWERCLMPLSLIQQKQRARWDHEMEKELAKKDPDLLQLFKLQRQKEQSQDWTDIRWHEQGLKNLQEEEGKKSLIQEKLRAKIQALAKEIQERGEIRGQA